MPLPPTPVTVRGGCNCGAVRYKIEVPELSQRPVYPNLPPEAYEDPKTPRFPFACTCHCNDCRRATAGLVHSAVCAPAGMVWVSALSRSSAQARAASTRVFDGPTFGDEARFGAREATGMLSDRVRDREDGSDGDGDGTMDRPPYKPGVRMLVPSPDSEDTFLNFHHSSDRRTRSFCGRCGTSISYNVWRAWPHAFEMLDVSLGTLDREDLEMWDIDTQLWWDYGVEWIKDLTRGSAAPKYESSKPVAEKLRS